MYDFDYNKTKPWELQKTLEENEEMLTQEDVVAKINAIIKPRDKALLSILYLTGARIGEIVRNKYHPSRFGLTKQRIIFEGYKGKQFMVIKLRNQKAKQNSKRWKVIPINMDHPIDGQLTKHIVEFLEYKDDMDPVFYIGTCMAARVVVRHIGFNPHWLRHTRLTHLSHKRRYSDQELMRIAGWTDARMSSTYVMTRWQDIADKEMVE
tara:strand:+ start:1814 stop:2437 length:624 start_codon:yes stop_codon:yes gene_type:complete